MSTLVVDIMNNDKEFVTTKFNGSNDGYTMGLGGHVPLLKTEGKKICFGYYGLIHSNGEKNYFKYYGLIHH